MFVLLWNPVVPKNDYTIDFLAAAAPIASISLSAVVIALHSPSGKAKSAFASNLVFQISIKCFGEFMHDL